MISFSIIFEQFKGKKNFVRTNYYATILKIFHSNKKTHYLSGFHFEYFKCD